MALTESSLPLLLGGRLNMDSFLRFRKVTANIRGCYGGTPPSASDLVPS
jgi:hypothetical protein